MGGNNSAELYAQIHAPIIDTELFSCVLCLCLLMIYALYFNIYRVPQPMQLFI